MVIRIYKNHLILSIVERLSPFTTGFVIFLFATLPSCKEPTNSKSPLLQKLIYIPEIHDDKDIFQADSLAFYEADSTAKIKYQNILKLNAVSAVKRNHVRSKLLNVASDTIIQIALSEQLHHEDSVHIVSFLELSKYELSKQKQFSLLPKLRQILTSQLPDYYKGVSCTLISKYYDETKNNLDSAWYYLMMAENLFKQTNTITPIHQKNIETITSYCTYKRKNLLAIRYANSLFDFENYFPNADSTDMARAYSNRAFMMFREGDIEGTKEDLELGLAYINPLKNSETYQHLMKSYLVLGMISNNDSLWQTNAHKIEQNIEHVKQDYIDMNRWRGQYYSQNGKHTEAIPFLKQSLQKEIKSVRRNSARYSTLCTLLSFCYEHIGKYETALDYMAMNAWHDTNYDMKKMLDHVQKSQSYSFFDALRCVQIYFSEYKATRSSKALDHAKTFMKMLDMVMFSQYEVADENAILQFYLETGGDYFQLGLDIYFESWKKDNQKADLEAFLNYSDKNKNSVMHRDMLMASKESGLPDEITHKEFNLRAAIKEEKRKGLRDNQTFDHLMDQYYLLELEMEKNHTSFVQKGLVKSELTIDQLKKRIPNENTCILNIDETETYWYYSLITKNDIIVQRVMHDQHKMMLTDTMINWMQTAEIADDKKKKMWRKAFIPEEIFIKLPSKIYFIPDGIYNRFPLIGLLKKQQTEIIHLPSSSLFDKFKQKNTSTKGASFFAFSDPETIKDTKRTSLAELPGSYKEVVSQSRHFPDAKVFTGKKATKSNFLKMYQDTNTTYIHVALHGLANSAEKDNVKLYFRTENGGLDSLYGYELLRYKSRCQKVVLSACQSGIGAYVNGEGSYSLPRYFMINGATDVVFNYWDVED